MCRERKPPPEPPGLRGVYPENSLAAFLAVPDEPVKRRAVDHIMISLRMMGRTERDQIAIVQSARIILFKRSYVVN